MPQSIQKLELGENHRRVISVVLRGVEKMAAECVSWLERPTGRLQQLRDDVTPAEAQALRLLLSRLRQELAQIEHEITLAPAVQSRRRTIAALVSQVRVDLEECQSPALRGYGPIDQNVERELDAKLSRLLVVLEAMSSIAEQK